MNPDNQQTTGSIIGLKKEFEEQYIALHNNTFPGVLERIHRSNISDYSIFLRSGILFSHMVYSGSDFESDMKAMGTDKTTREWWKLTDPMQEPLEIRKENEWWAQINLWYTIDFKTTENKTSTRRAFTFPVQPDPVEKIPDDFFGDFDFWGTTYDLKCLKIFRSIHNLYIYIETFKPSELSGLLEIIARVLKSDARPEEMQEVFHTENKNPVKLIPKKKVFVTGCFDLLHSGHIAFMQEAATYGELYVSIGADENVHHLKGRYPVNTQDERKYMIDSLACVKKCMVNSGWGYIDFQKELRDVMPDVFVVNEDGHTPSKQALCEEMGIEYHILKRIPHADLPVRSTTTLRTECTIPFRIDLAGGWLDQPYVSLHHPGSVLTISIEPTIEFNDRSGMSSSTRRKAIELWRNEIPHGDTEHLARMLFSFENPPGTKHVSGSQDSLGIVYPGLNKLDYNGSYWPVKINTIHDEGILTWVEKKLYLVTLGPRVSSYSPLENTNITPAGAKALADATEDCWEAIQKKDIQAFGNAFRRSFEAQIAMFPNMVDPDILHTIDLYKEKVWGWKLSGAGGGGYIILVSDTPVEGAMQIKIRRKNNF
jgi:cytidyltransferase-like protein